MQYPNAPAPHTLSPKPGIFCLMSTWLFASLFLPHLVSAATLSDEPNPLGDTCTMVAIASQSLNIRQGPGTLFPVVMVVDQGTPLNLIGQNAAGDWYQINSGNWYFSIFATIVSSPPCSLPITAGARVYLPLITQQTVTTYLFNIVVVSHCLPQAAGNWFEGTTDIGGQPQNGYKVVFSFAPDAQPITAPVISGPHQGYPGWRTGYYSHIIHASGPQVGDWYVWIVDDAAQRISAIGHWHSTGASDNTCNQAQVDFDSQ